MRKAALALSLLLSLLALTAPTAQAATCPNEALREAQSATALPGCMALEMASPPKKFSQPSLLPSFSKDGERLQMIIQTALAGSPGYQYYGGDRYVATRAAGGWQIASTSPLDPDITSGGRRWGSAAAFTPDLSSWAQLGSTQQQFQVGVAQLFKGGLDNSFDPLSPPLLPIDDSGTEKVQQSIEDLEFTGASADLSTAVLRVTLASTGYLPGDPRRPDSSEAEPGLDRNSYVAFTDEAGQPALELLARDKDGVVYGGRCGAHIGGEGATFHQGAISPDGERIFVSTRPNQPWNEETIEGPACDTDNPLRILKRASTPAGAVMAELLPGGPSAPGDDLFQAASADGAKVYLTTPRKLAASDADAQEDPCSGVLGASAGCDLYLYDESKPPAQRVTQVSDGEGAEEADVLSSITAVSGDGSHAYFAAQAALTADPNPEGDLAIAGEPNLYLFEAGAEELSFIATLSPQDAGALWGTKGSFFGDAYAAPLHGQGPEEGGDGHVLAFASKAPITADDEDAGHRDVFRYDADAETLQRISTAPEGGADNGPFDAAVNPAYLKVIEYNFAEAGRWVSEDGQTIAFSTEEPLLPADEDEAANPYVWHAGALGASFAPISEPPAVAPLGGQLAFSTPAPLLPQDGDAAKDTYIAREGGGFPFPVAPTECDPLQEGSCEQGAPAPQGPAAFPSASFSGPGNAAKPSRCRKGQVKRRGRCVRKARKGKGKVRKGAGQRRGGRR